MEIREITAYIRANLLHLTRKDCADGCGLHVDDAIDMEDNQRIQSASKLLARMLIEKERNHYDHAQWTRHLSREELLEMYPEWIVRKILAGRERKGKTYTAAQKRKREKNVSAPTPLPSLPSDEYIARLVYEYANSGKCPPPGLVVYTLYPNKMTCRLRAALHVHIRQILRGALKVCSIDQIDMDEMIRLAYKMCVQPKARGSAKRHGRRGTAHHSDGLSKDYDPGW